MLQELLTNTKTPVAPFALAAAAALAAYALLRKNNRNSETQTKKDIEDPEFFNSIKEENVIHMNEYPSISLSSLQNPNVNIADNFAKQIHSFGFVVITLPDDVRQIMLDMFNSFEDFMKQDYFDVKRKAQHPDKNLGFFQVPSQGFETFQFKHNNDPNFKWPTDPPNFKSHAIKYYEFLHDICCNIFRLFSIHLQLDDVDYFTKMMDELPLQEGQYVSSTIRMFRYFNTADTIKHDLTHIDIALGAIVPGAGFEGLQIYLKDRKKWVEIEKTITKGDLVFFPGSLFQLITNHYFMGTIHRVVRHPQSERYSIPIALMPRDDAKINIAPSSVIDSEKLKISKEYASMLPFTSIEFVENEYRKRAVRRMMRDLRASDKEEEEQTREGKEQDTRREREEPETQAGKAEEEEYDH